MHAKGGCCGCHHSGMGRRTFLGAIGGASVAMSALFAQAAKSIGGELGPLPYERDLQLPRKELVVQPVLSYQLFERREATSWRSWGGFHNTSDIEKEKVRIQSELETIAKQAEFSLKFLPLEEISSMEQAEKAAKVPADVILIYAATGGLEEIEKMISPGKKALVFLRHKSGPVYLWYEIAHPRLLRKTVDVYGQPGLSPADVVVDEIDDLVWRLRSIYAVKNTMGTKIVAIGDASGWGEGGKEAPRVASEKWKLDIVPVTYDDLGKRLESAKADTGKLKKALARAEDYLKAPGTRLETERGFVERAFLLTDVFEELMLEANAPALTVNHCMGTIMPLSETTACLTLSVLNDAGAMAFCESDFVVIPSGILLHHLSHLPVFLQDPTYPHHGKVTVAHCTAPRRMDGQRLEPALLETHFESDYGVAPKVEMKIGQYVTVIDPDFEEKKWLGFGGTIVDNPHMDICRSQIDIDIEGDWERLVEEMVGFHWMLCYGDYRKETGYALRQVGIEWLDVSKGRIAERIG